MADVIELKNGGLITPLNVFDVLDIVEEYLGTDLRQYLEEFLVSGETVELSASDSLEAMEDHYIQVLMNIDDVVMDMKKKLSERRMNREVLTECAGRIQDMVRRERKC